MFFIIQDINICVLFRILVSLSEFKKLLESLYPLWAVSFFLMLSKTCFFSDFACNALVKRQSHDPVQYLVVWKLIKGMQNGSE